jgi:hypothetical protein
MNRLYHHQPDRSVGHLAPQTKKQDLLNNAILVDDLGYQERARDTLLFVDHLDVDVRLFPIKLAKSRSGLSHYNALSCWHYHLTASKLAPCCCLQLWE